MKACWLKVYNKFVLNDEKLDLKVRFNRLLQKATFCLQIIARGFAPDGGGTVIFTAPIVKTLRPVQVRTNLSGKMIWNFFFQKINFFYCCCSFSEQPLVKSARSGARPTCRKCPPRWPIEWSTRRRGHCTDSSATSSSLSTNAKGILGES